MCVTVRSTSLKTSSQCCERGEKVSFVLTWLLTVPTLFFETLPERRCTGSSSSGRSLWSQWLWKLQVWCDTECVSVSSCCHFAVLQPTQQTHIVLLDFTTTTTTAAAGYLLTRRKREDSGSLSIFNADEARPIPLHYVAVLILLQRCWSYLTKATAPGHFSKLQRVDKKSHISYQEVLINHQKE